METTIIIFNSLSNATELSNQANKIRLSNKNKWYQISFENETTGEKVGLKCFNTWVQICTKPLFHNCMDNTPTEFKKNISEGVKKLIESY